MQVGVRVSSWFWDWYSLRNSFLNAQSLVTVCPWLKVSIYWMSARWGSGHMSPFMLNFKHLRFYGQTWKIKCHLQYSFHRKLYSRIEALLVLQINFLENMFFLNWRYVVKSHYSYNLEAFIYLLMPQIGHLRWDMILFLL